MKTKILLLVLIVLKNITSSFAQPGTLDRTFNFDGKVFTTIGGYNDGANTIAIQKNGKILAAGYTQDAKGKSAFALVRYLTHGNVDRSFGNNGIVTTYFYNDNNSVANAMAIQDDGKIILAGFAKIGKYNNAFAVARYKTDGSLDSSFSLNGKTVTDIDSSDDRANAIAIQPDGKIVVAGYRSYPADIAVVRYQSNGTPDSSFGINGKVITGFLGYEGFHNSDYANTIAVLPNGKIIIGGHSDPIYGSMSFILVRYKSNGTIDSSFGKDGSTFNSLDVGSAGNSLAVLSNGKILLGGYTQSIAIGFTLMQYKKDGTLDSSFGSNGIALPSYYSGYGKSIAVQQNGKIIMAGFTKFNNNPQQLKLMRFNPHGVLDSSFGLNGIVFTDMQGKYDYFFSGPATPAVALQSDGQIVVAGNGKGKFAVVRYNGDNICINHLKQDSTVKQNIITTYSADLFPNPVKDILNLQNLSSSKKTISVIDLNGKVLQEVITSNKNYSINVKQLLAGIYFVRIDREGKISTMKFMKE